MMMKGDLSRADCTDEEKKTIENYKEKIESLLVKVKEDYNKVSSGNGATTTSLGMTQNPLSSVPVSQTSESQQSSASPGAGSTASPGFSSDVSSTATSLLGSTEASSAPVSSTASPGSSSDVSSTATQPSGVSDATGSTMSGSTASPGS